MSQTPLNLSKSVKSESSLDRGVLVLTFDQLNTAFLGPYGNTWLPTPGWNELAASSLLLEQCFTPHTTLREAFVRLWSENTPSPTLANQLSTLQVQTTLWSDDTTVLSLGSETGFSSLQPLPSPSCVQAAEELEQTVLYQQIQSTLDQLTSSNLSGLNWIHLKAITGPWDAPLPLRAALFDEEIGEPPDWILPPPVTTTTPLESDDLLRWQVSYGAQIQVIDFCLQYTLGWLESLPAHQRPLVIVSSPRGCNVGTHGVCLNSDAIWTENVQIPLLIYDGDRTRCLRSQGLASWVEIGPTLIAYFGNHEPTSEYSLLRRIDAPGLPGIDRCLLNSGTETGLRTTSWFLRLPSKSQPQLFIKPDDRNDVSEISQRLGDVTEQLLKVTQELQESEGSVTQQIPDPPVD